MSSDYKSSNGTTTDNRHAKKRLSKNLVPIQPISVEDLFTPKQSIADHDLENDDSACDNRATQQTFVDDREIYGQANLQLQEFVYAISHDLKTPLRAINGFSTLLANDYAEQLDDKGKRYLKRITDGSVLIDQLISGLTELSRICAEESNFVQIAMNEVVEDVVDDLRELIEETAAVVTWDPLPKVFGDAMQLMQLFRNLIENGIRFRSKAPVKIHVSYKTIEIGHQFEVRDNGIGIDEKDYERAFTMFRRVGVQDAETIGLGAGLTICRRIVERHGGQIKLESELEFGTRVIFSIHSKSSS